MKTIETKNAPATIGPYSQAKIVGNLVYCSGQLPVNPVTNLMPDTVSEQTHQSCKNVAALLIAAGTSIDKVVKTTCFLADIADFGEFNKVYEQYFTSKPARSCIAVKDIPKGALVEIEVIAEL